MAVTQPTLGARRSADLLAAAGWSVSNTTVARAAGQHHSRSAPSGGDAAAIAQATARPNIGYSTQ